MLVRAFWISILGCILLPSVWAQPAASVRERIRGSYLGLVYGDAYGSLTKNWNPSQILIGLGNLKGIPKEVPHLNILRAVGEPQFLRTRPFGLISAAAQQATLLAIVGINHREYWTDLSTRDWANHLIAGTKANIWRGHGKIFAEAVTRLVRGHDLRLTGSFSAGIGAAMRTGVLGAIYHLDLDSLRRASLESSLVTHTDIRAVAIAYATSWTVYALLNDYPLEFIRRRLPAEVEHIELQCLRLLQSGWQINGTSPHEISRSLRNIMAKNPQTAEELRSLIIENATQVVGEKRIELHINNPYSLLGGIHAVLLPLLDDIEPMQSLSEVVMLGSDTDMVAAIAGSILGARFGDAWIPTHELKFFDRWNRMASEVTFEKPMPAQKFEHYLAYERAALEMERSLQADCALRLPALRLLR